jgi:rsbT co-antagonist protein RsbR
MARKVKRGDAAGHESGGAAVNVGKVQARDLVEHFEENRDRLRQQWVQQMTAKKLLEGLTAEEIQMESITIYDMCIECLKTGVFVSARDYAGRMAERDVLRGMKAEQIIDGLLVLRDVYARSIYGRFQHDYANLIVGLDIYEPVANRILSIAAFAFVEERDKMVRKQQEAIRELSTPILSVRDRLLLLPIIGVLDSVRARQLTEQLLRAIRANRAKAVVIDITGVPNVDSKVANHLIQTIDASRLLGAMVVVTGLSAEMAQTLVTIGVDLSKFRTIVDLQGGIEEADRILGLRVNPLSGDAPF